VRVVRSTATVGGGSVSIAGRAPINGFRLGDVTSVVTAKGVSVPIVDGIAMTCDADLRAEWKEKSSDEEESVLPGSRATSPLRRSATPPIGIGTADMARSPSAIAASVRGLRSCRRLRDVRPSTPVERPAAPAQQPGRGAARGRLRRTRFFGTNQRFGLRGRMRLLPGGRIRCVPTSSRSGRASYGSTTRTASRERRHHGGDRIQAVSAALHRGARSTSAEPREAPPTPAAFGASRCMLTGTPTICVST